MKATTCERWIEDQALSTRVLKELNIEPPRCDFDVGAGWVPIVERALRRMIDAGWDRQLAQVKEKAYGLRIYVENPVSQEVQRAIHDAEAEARITCEACGRGHDSPDSSVCAECR